MSQNLPLDRERRSFEAALGAHAESAGHDDAALSLEWDGSGYTSKETQAALWGFKARADMAASVPPVYLSERDLAKRYSLTLKTIQKWRTDLTGPPFYKIGRTVRYEQAEVESYDLASRIQTNNQTGGEEG